MIISEDHREPKSNIGTSLWMVRQFGSRLNRFLLARQERRDARRPNLNQSCTIRQNPASPTGQDRPVPLAGGVPGRQTRDGPDASEAPAHDPADRSAT